jgi:hypothetical protein
MMENERQTELHCLDRRAFLREFSNDAYGEKNAKTEHLRPLLNMFAVSIEIP